MDIIDIDDFVPETQELQDYMFNDQFIQLSDDDARTTWSGLDDNKPFAFPVLYSLKVKGDGILFYCLAFDGKNMHTRYGQQDGVIKENIKEVIPKGKRTIYQQAHQIMKRQYIDKCKHRYSCTIPTNNTSIRTTNVSLANKYDPKFIKTYPVAVEPKLDGFRFTAVKEDDQIILRSRVNNHIHHLNHIRTELLNLFARLPKDSILDGELYCHGMSFREISSAIKNVNNIHKDNHRIQAHLFDIIEDDKLTYMQRRELLEEAIPEHSSYKHVILVDMDLAEDQDIIHNIYTEYLDEGYEGAMIKNINALYRPTRTNDILKYKTIEHDEGKIVDVIPGTGSHRKLAILVVKDSLEVITNIVPKETHAIRAKWLEDRELMIGRRYKFSFQERHTDTNAPRNPVGICLLD